MPRGRDKIGKKCHLCDSKDTHYFYSKELAEFLGLTLWTGVYLCSQHEPDKLVEEEDERRIDNPGTGTRPDNSLVAEHDREIEGQDFPSDERMPQPG